MKNLLLVIFTFFAFFACSSPSSSDKGGEKNKEYSIIFNFPSLILGESGSLGLIDPDGTNMRTIGLSYDILDFSVSDDGSKAVYEAGVNNCCIDVADIVSDSVNILHNIKGGSAIISPDGNFIAYLSYDYETGDYGLAVMDINGENSKVILPDTYPEIFRWTTDSKGIEYLEHYTIAYYIDKEGESDPVQIENNFMLSSQERLALADTYDLNQFDRAEKSFANERDSVTILPEYYNTDKSFAYYWYLRIVDSMYVSRTLILTYAYNMYIYDFKNMTETLMIDSLVGDFPKTVWSSNNEDILVATANDMELINVNGSRQIIIEYEDFPKLNFDYWFYFSPKWIPKH